MLTKAIAVALQAHEGQFDKGGHPYILHPLRVMLSCESEIDQICGVMHDVLEDSSVKTDDLRELGFTDQILEVLDCLTRRPEETYDQFIDRLLVNQIACRVKLADLADNMNLSRIKNPTDQDFERFKKYETVSRKIREKMALKYGR